MNQRQKTGLEANSHQFQIFNINEDNQHPYESKQQQYYNQYKRVYQTAYRIDVQLHRQKELKRQLIEKLKKLEKKINQPKQKLPSKRIKHRKRLRRLADQIQRPFKCSYGSDGSLQQHVKLKHPELYQSKKFQN